MDSRLEGRPILIGGTGDRGVVASCSYEARGFGVHSGMSMKMARAMCPEAVVIRGNSMAYSKQSEIVTDIVREAVPVCEKSSIDEFYADLSGMDRFFGCWQFSRELRERVIRESGLPISVGLSTSKTVAKVATGEAKPNNARHVSRGTERHFLAPLSVRKIPMVGAETYRTLRNLGISTIRTLQDMPVELIQQVLGKNGVAIWKKAHGLDDTPVIAYNERKSISTERTFAKDTTDGEKLHAIMLAMAENLAFQLRRGDKLTACVTVKVRYADFSTKSMQRRIPYTAADHHLVPVAKDLLEQPARQARARPSHRGALQPPRRGWMPNQPVRRHRRTRQTLPSPGPHPRAVRRPERGARRRPRSPNHRPHQPLQRRPPTPARPPASMMHFPET